jgi:hypothetical protein
MEMFQNVENLYLINAIVLGAPVRQVSLNLEGWYDESAEMAA